MRRISSLGVACGNEASSTVQLGWIVPMLALVTRTSSQNTCGPRSTDSGSGCETSGSWSPLWCESASVPVTRTVLLASFVTSCSSRGSVPSTTTASAPARHLAGFESFAIHADQGHQLPVERGHVGCGSAFRRLVVAVSSHRIRGPCHTIDTRNTRRCHPEEWRRSQACHTGGSRVRAMSPHAPCTDTARNATSSTAARAGRCSG